MCCAPRRQLQPDGAEGRLCVGRAESPRAGGVVRLEGLPDLLRFGRGVGVGVGVGGGWAAEAGCTRSAYPERVPRACRAHTQCTCSRRTAASNPAHTSSIPASRPTGASPPPPAALARGDEPAEEAGRRSAEAPLARRARASAPDMRSDAVPPSPPSSRWEADEERCESRSEADALIICTSAT